MLKIIFSIDSQSILHVHIYLTQALCFVIVFCWRVWIPVPIAIRVKYKHSCNNHRYHVGNSLISYQDHVVSLHFLLLSHLELLYTSLHIFHAYIVVYVSISLVVNFRFLSDLDCRVRVCGKSTSYVSFVVSDCWHI